MLTCLTIAGSDCSGGAGIQADLKTFSAHGLFGMSVVVSVVAENTATVTSVMDVSPEVIRDQMDCVFTDIPPNAVKVGMLSTEACMQAVADGLRAYNPPHVVIDPVMVAKNGSPLMQPESIEAFQRIVLPLASLLTPNIPEAEVLLGVKINTEEDMREAAQALSEKTAGSVLVKGGHRVGDAVDILFDGKTCHRFQTERIDTKNTHGTGCTLSSAIASNLALGHSEAEAVRRAKDYVTTAIRHSLELGKGNGPTHHFYRLYNEGLAWLEDV